MDRRHHQQTGGWWALEQFEYRLMQVIHEVYHQRKLPMIIYVTAAPHCPQSVKLVNYLPNVSGWMNGKNSVISNQKVGIIFVDF